MGSLSGFLQRPVIAASAVAIASVADNFRSLISSPPEQQLDDSSPVVSNSVQHLTYSWASHISVSKLSNLSFVARIGVPLPNVNNDSFKVPALDRGGGSVVPQKVLLSSSSALVGLYQSAALLKASKPSNTTSTLRVSSAAAPDVLYRWHLPEASTIDVECSLVKSRTVVVLLGWLGAKQKHLKRYAEWYTSRGYHVITFTFPMAEILSYQVGGKAEQNVDLLANHLADWLEDEHGKNLIFHTFSNTGWLTYGAILEKFQKQDPSIIGRIRGCIVDSAPVAAPDPQVWASGFSAAFLKKNSVTTKGFVNTNEQHTNVFVDNKEVGEPKPAVTETALLLILEKFFKVVLHLPAVNRRLSDILCLLSLGQPSCPQLYIYSSADRVIPAESVESFVEEQRRAGREVRACNFVSTPHVDHFRNDPQLYTRQLSQFLEDCAITCCKHS